MARPKTLGSKLPPRLRLMPWMTNLPALVQLGDLVQRLMMKASRRATVLEHLEAVELRLGRHVLWHGDGAGIAVVIVRQRHASGNGGCHMRAVAVAVRSVPNRASPGLSGLGLPVSVQSHCATTFACSLNADGRQKCRCPARPSRCPAAGAIARFAGRTCSVWTGSAGRA